MTAEGLCALARSRGVMKGCVRSLLEEKDLWRALQDEDRARIKLAYDVKLVRRVPFVMANSAKCGAAQMLRFPA